MKSGNLSPRSLPRFGPVSLVKVTAGGTLESKLEVTAGASRKRSAETKEVKELIADHGDDAAAIRTLVKESLKADRRQRQEAEFHQPRVQRWKLHRSENRGIAWVHTDFQEAAPKLKQHDVTREGFTISQDEWLSFGEGLRRWSSFAECASVLRVIHEAGQNWSVVADRLAVEMHVDCRPEELEGWYSLVTRNAIDARIARLETCGEASDLVEALLTIARRTRETLCQGPSVEELNTKTSQLKAQLVKLSTADVDKRILSSMYSELREKLQALQQRVTPDLSLPGAFAGAEEVVWTSAVIADEVRQTFYNTFASVPTVLKEAATLSIPRTHDKLHREVEVTLEAILEDDMSDACATPAALAHCDTIRSLLTANAYLHRQVAKLQRLRSEVDKLRALVAEFKSACEAV